MTLSNGKGPMERPDAVAEAWRMHKEESRSTRYIAQALTERGYTVSRSTVAEFIREARDAEPWIDLLEPAIARREQADRLNSYVAILLDEMREGREKPLPVIKGLMQIEERWAKLAGLDAPTRIATQNETRPVAPDPKILQALERLERDLAHEKDEDDD